MDVSKPLSPDSVANIVSFVLNNRHSVKILEWNGGGLRRASFENCRLTATLYIRITFLVRVAVSGFEDCVTPWETRVGTREAVHTLAGLEGRVGTCSLDVEFLRRLMGAVGTVM